MLFDSPFYFYHQQTKHTVEKLTSNRHFLDWANQPNPFRSYDGAQEIALPRQLIVSPVGYFEAMEKMLSGNLCDKHAPDASFVSNLLFYSMAISAWKQIAGTDHRWALRVNPSSGNLHPTDTHLLLTGVEGLSDGLYHYNVPRHALEYRSDAVSGVDLWQSLTGSSSSPPVVICLTSIFWRESWKYQSRAFRYCQHDLGHAMASIMLSAGVIGWQVQVVGEFPDQKLVDAIGLSDTDERPFLVLGLFPDKVNFERKRSEVLQLKETIFRGTANVLSAEEITYHAIDDVYHSTVIDETTWRARQELQLPTTMSRPPFIESIQDAVAVPDVDLKDPESVHRTIRTRRSAVDLDGQRTMLLSQLHLILKTATKGFTADFQSKGSFHLIDLYLYVHRVEGLTPGVYFWDRLKEELLPITLSNQKQIAKFVSCFQDIAADGCFALSMIANLNLSYELFGNRGYRYVHYEAGAIGQWLYLSATALNYQATGIGCFLDDEINKYLPLPDGYEVIYNFTVGEAVLDPRLTTLAAYDFVDPSLL